MIVRKIYLGLTSNIFRFNHQIYQIKSKMGKYNKFEA